MGTHANRGGIGIRTLSLGSLQRFPDSLRCLAVPLGDSFRFGPSVKAPGVRVQNTVHGCSRQDVRPHFQGDRPLRVFPDGEAGNAQGRGLLLKPSTVGQHHQRISPEKKRFLETQGSQKMNIPRKTDSKLRDHLGGPGVDREKNRRIRGRTLCRLMRIGSEIRR